jgi:hypothetical protein
MKNRHETALRLLPLLQRDLQALEQSREPVTVAYRKTLLNPYSDVHVFQLAGMPRHRHLYVKVPHLGSQNLAVQTQRLRSEFEMLQRLHRRSHGDVSAPYGSVVPLGLYPDFPALATFEAAPTTLREHYRNGARWLLPGWPGPSRSTLLSEVRHCGQWLREFQQATDAGWGPFPWREWLDYLDIRLRALAHLPGLQGAEQLAQDLRLRVQTVAQGIEPGTHRLCGRHNDFSSHNILARDGRIWVIDFSMVDTSSFAFDPATFWLELEMLKADPSHSTGFLSALQDQFLQAYGAITPDDPAFALVRCQYQLNRILTLHTRLRWPTPGALYGRTVVRRCLADLRALAAGTVA